MEMVPSKQVSSSWQPDEELLSETANSYSTLISFRNTYFEEKMLKICPFQYLCPPNAHVIAQRGVDGMAGAQPLGAGAWEALAVSGLGEAGTWQPALEPGLPSLSWGIAKNHSILITNDFVKSSAKWNYLPLTCSTQNHSCYVGV